LLGLRVLVDNIEDILVRPSLIRGCRVEGGGGARGARGVKGQCFRGIFKL